MTSHDDGSDDRTVVFTISSEDLSTTSNSVKNVHLPGGHYQRSAANGGRRGSSQQRRGSGQQRTERSASLDDIVPHADYYRNETDSTFFAKNRRRPTLIELHTVEVLPVGGALIFFFVRMQKVTRVCIVGSAVSAREQTATASAVQWLQTSTESR